MPEWRPYDIAARATMVVDAKCRVVNDFNGAGRIASQPLLGEDPASVMRGALFRYSE
jgi:hypothetical protein